jgi:hypothetical protein
MDIIIDLQNDMVALWDYLFEDTKTDPMDEVYISDFLATLIVTAIMFIVYGWYMVPINYIRNNIKDYDFKIERKI